MTKTIRPSAKFLLAVTLASLSVVATAEDSELRAKIGKLEAELNALKTDTKTLETKTEAVATQQEASQAPATKTAQAGTGATLWGYGEINYNRPQDDASQTQMDLRRAVFGIGFRFDEHTRLVSEYEVEHAITSADDSGEVAVEQFYIDHQVSTNNHIKVGLFLIPAGMLNENHEPNTYFGVERNFVETAIIPTTWREGGVALYGSTEYGLAWDVGLTTTVDLSGWDASSDEGRESPLGSIHQELQLAKAADLGTYGAVNFRGIPGWVVGGSVFTSQVSQKNDDIGVASSTRMTLWDVHTHWTPGAWDLSALYARGSFSDTAALNLRFAGLPTPVPQAFFGWYTQAAYKVWQNGSYSLSPFLRYEGFNTASAYEPMPAGLAVATGVTEKVVTSGVSFFLNPKVVIKLDYQKFSEAGAQDRLNLGLGLAF